MMVNNEMGPCVRSIDMFIRTHTHYTNLDFSTDINSYKLKTKKKTKAREKKRKMNFVDLSYVPLKRTANTLLFMKLIIGELEQSKMSASDVENVEFMQSTC